MQRKAAYKRVSLELQPTKVSSSLDRNHQQQRQISNCDYDYDCDYDDSIYHNSDGITTSMRNSNKNNRNRTIIRNKTRQRNLGLAFWIAGVLNNAGYVIMIAAAKSISEGGVALVFLANILPALVVKATAPYWFETISYHCRLRAATGLMVLSFGMVASCRNSLQWQLAGVACTSAQASLGEASLLALAGKMDGELELELVQAKANQAAALEEESLQHKGEHNNGEGSNPNGTSSSSSSSSNKGGISICLNGFSSGTGFAGVFGFFWVWFWNHSLGFSLSATLWLAMVLAAGYLVSYTTIQRLRFELLQQQQIEQMQQQMQQQQDGMIQYNRQQQQKQKHDNNNNNKGSKTELVTNETAESSLLYGTHENDDVDVHTNNDDNNNNNSENEEDDTSIHDEDEDRALVSNAVDPPDSTSTTTKTTKTTTNDVVAVQDISSMTSGERFYLVLTLWPYMVPLFTVYVAEYTLQSGTWTAIGFPTVASKESRDTFYRYSNWTYQVGVFISRSSGTCMVAPMALLWAMPFLQCANVVLYWAVAAHQSVDININDDIDITTNDTIDASLSSMVVSFVSSPYFLYPGALYAGLLGGAVYVHGYLRICKDLPLPHREFALSATSLAECLGIVVADVLGLLVQACLYQIHGLDGAVMACPN